MPKNSEIQMMMEAIIKQHGGQAYLNFGEASKIIGCEHHPFEIMDKAG